MKIGPCQRTRRSRAAPRSWRGLTWQDTLLLSTWLARIAPPPDELHTDILLGKVPEGCEDDSQTPGGRLAETVYGLRLDAALQFKDQWWIIELKPEASHKAFGQILTYCHWWNQLPGLPPCPPCYIITDHADPHVAAAAEHRGIHIVELGDVFDDETERKD